MMIQIHDKYLTFSLFEEFPHLFCAMSTKKAGNLDIKDIISLATFDFLKVNYIPKDSFVTMQQIHGSTVVQATKGKKIASDGLITQIKGLYLGVQTADCVPLFFYEPEVGLVGVVHAGWRGTLAHISQNMIKKLVDYGARIDQIRVAIGPHIGACCYDVSKERAIQFQEEFPRSQAIFSYVNKWYIDIGLLNREALLEKGVQPAHIDAAIACTSCQSDLYFSYRRHTKETFGHMLGIIGIRN